MTKTHHDSIVKIFILLIDTIRLVTKEISVPEYTYPNSKNCYVINLRLTFYSKLLKIVYN